MTSMPTFGFGIYVVLLLMMLSVAFATGTASRCPHCGGNFQSCTWGTSKTCPTIDVVSANALVVAAGTGALTLLGLIKPRFLKIFSRVALESILALVKRSEPGTTFTIDKTTKPTAILTAIANGLTTLEIASFKLCEILEDLTDADERDNMKYKMECLKTSSDVRAKLPALGLSGLMDSGVLTFMWAKVSSFVLEKGMQVKLNMELPDASRDRNAADLTAKIVRPSSFIEYSEMMNLFGLYMHSLAICSYLVLADFWEHVVYDTIRLRNESWKFAHELMLIMFRRVEDSGGTLTLGNVYDESHLNSLMLAL